MKVKYIIGDLLKGKDEVIAHGCNCQGQMGAGVAKQIAKKWPIVKKKDIEYFKEMKKYSDYGQFGKILVVMVKNKMVVNLYTQKGIGQCFEIRAFFVTMHELLKKMPLWKTKTLGIPWIGCGLGGGDKEQVKDVIELMAKCHPKVQITVYSLEEEDEN